MPVPLPRPRVTESHKEKGHELNTEDNTNYKNRNNNPV
jgi:hypothetical protein